MTEQPLTDANPGDLAADEEAYAQRILNEPIYAGKTAEEVALLEEGERGFMLVPWVERIRRDNGYDERGYPNPRWEWDQWTKEERIANGREMRHRGISVRRAAERLGISASTLQYYLRD